MHKNPSPWAYIPSLYFVEGLPYILINVVSAALYSKLGVPNDVFAFWTGFLYLPWTLKISMACFLSDACFSSPRYRVIIAAASATVKVPSGANCVSVMPFTTLCSTRYST